MRSPLLILLGCVALMVYAVPASANLMFRFDIDLSGTGHGTVTEILGFPNPGGQSNGIQSGCVERSLTGVDEFGNCANIYYPPYAAFGNDQLSSGGNKSQTVLVNNVMPGMTPWDLAIAYDPSQGSSDPMQIDQMVAWFYRNDTNEEIYSAYLPTPHYISNPGTGSGGSGFLFSLDWEQATVLDGIIAGIQDALPNFSFSDVRLGLGAEMSGVKSHSYFYVLNVNDIVQTPEPVSVFLVLSGLGAVALLHRRKQRG